MRIVIAPDKFAGTLSAAEAADAMAAGWRDARPDDDLVTVPMADGGAGSVDVMAEGIDEAVVHTAEVADPLGRGREGRFVLLPDGGAFVEAAEACGLRFLSEEERNPMRTTTYGVGQLLRAAVGAGATRIVIGLGGSATVDGGTGMAIALGHRLLRGDGNGIKVGAEALLSLDRIDAGPHLDVPVVIASDVTNPLLGPDGAAPVFGPQKGADEEMVGALAERLQHVADVVERDLDGGPWRDHEGAGAAGGLGFALLAFCGAEMRTGAAAIADLVGFGEAVEAADVVLTGEGKLDAQTAKGKAPAWVADQARSAGARVLAVAGVLADGAGGDFDDAIDLGPDGEERAAELVRARTAELAGRLDA